MTALADRSGSERSRRDPRDPEARLEQLLEALAAAPAGRCSHGNIPL
ncbi:hypothetical protein [Saccharopolyspora rosea]|uniref:Uncharacterized protein n=1 Tax=Saccharopolyspora rosea TaxID=524884 RepID=A0ABW3FV82_9PSEU|nr:hypothetical protein [Saccharopolyspora rosea]